jgi:hypothetical protein
VELFEQIQREYEHGGGTIRGIAKKLGIHRRMVREAVLSAVPVERKTPVRERPKLEPAMAYKSLPPSLKFIRYSRIANVEYNHELEAPRHRCGVKALCLS